MACRQHAMGSVLNGRDTESYDRPPWAIGSTPLDNPVSMACRQHAMGSVLTSASLLPASRARRDMGYSESDLYLMEVMALNLQRHNNAPTMKRQVQSPPSKIG